MASEQLPKETKLIKLFIEQVDNEISFNHRYRMLHEKYENLEKELDLMKSKYDDLVLIFDKHVKGCPGVESKVVKSSVEVHKQVEKLVTSNEKPTISSEDHIATSLKEISTNSSEDQTASEKVAMHTENITASRRLSFACDPPEATKDSVQQERNNVQQKDRSRRSLLYSEYLEKRKKLNVRFSKQGKITSLIVMASNGKFVNPDHLAEKNRGVAILRVSTAAAAPAQIELFKALFPRINLDRIVISLGTNDIDHVLHDSIVVKRLNYLKSCIQFHYKDAKVSVMGLLPRQDREVNSINSEILAKIDDSHLYENISHQHLYDCKHIAKNHIGKLVNNLKAYLHVSIQNFPSIIPTVSTPDMQMMNFTPSRINRQQPYASVVAHGRRPKTEQEPDRDTVLQSILDLLSSFRR